MLIKQIMDTLEANSEEHIYTDSFIIYKNTFKKYSDTRFFHFAIHYNIGIPENKKEDIINLYVKSKNIINILNKFSKKIQFSIFKKYDYNKDLRFNSLDAYKENEVVKINQNKTIYKFRIMDLIYLWKIALLTNENMFALPKNLKNPYTNIAFKNHNLYNIFFSFNKTNYVVPEIILSYFKCSFDMEKFKKKSYPELQENAIQNYTSEAFYLDLIEYLLTMLHTFRIDINYIFLKRNLSILKKKIIIKKMENLITLYLKYKFLCNPLLKDKYFKVLRRKIKLFFEKEFSSDYFIRLSNTEQNIYEGNNLNDEETEEETNTINNNSISLETIAPPSAESTDVSSNFSISNTLREINRQISIAIESESDDEEIFPNPPSESFVFRRRPFHRRRQSIYIPSNNANINSIVNNYTPLVESSPTTNSSITTPTNNIIQRNPIRHRPIIRNSISRQTRPTRLPPINTASNPFTPNRELSRTPRQQNTADIIRNRFVLFQ